MRKPTTQHEGFRSPSERGRNRRNTAPGWTAEELLPPLPPNEYAALKESISRNGVRVPIIVDQHGNTIDGRHRDRACRELGMYCPREVRHFESDAERLEVAMTLNVSRRHLTRSQRRELISVYLTTDPRINDNHLGEIVGVSKNTVASVRHKLESTRQIDKLEQRRGRDGKDRPATYRRIMASTPKETEKAMAAITDLPASNKILDVTTASRRAAKQRNRVTREGREIVPLCDGDIRLHHCRFQELQAAAGIEAGSVNLVLTDIPYGQEFLGQIGDLGEFAAQVLVEGGLLVTVCGQYWLHKVMEALGKHLAYRWTNASVWDGDATPVHIGGWKEPHGRVLSKWKPILVFSKGGFPKRGQWCDVSHVNEKEKDWHPWQQPLTEVEMLVRYFSDAGDLVVDPCGGGFTTAVACRNLGRRFIGCDVEQGCVSRGSERLATMVPVCG